VDGFIQIKLGKYGLSVNLGKHGVVADLYFDRMWFEFALQGV
jgi:hypothetical protein